MDLMRDQLLADSALAADQYRRVNSRGELNLGPDMTGRFTRSHEPATAVRRQEPISGGTGGHGNSSDASEDQVD
jgi:hypothetical protein